jgi:hypothetical protein
MQTIDYEPVEPPLAGPFEQPLVVELRFERFRSGRCAVDRRPDLPDYFQVTGLAAYAGVPLYCAETIALP